MSHHRPPGPARPLAERQWAVLAVLTAVLATTGAVAGAVIGADDPAPAPPPAGAPPPAPVPPPYVTGSDQTLTPAMAVFFAELGAAGGVAVTTVNAETVHTVAVRVCERGDDQAEVRGAIDGLTLDQARRVHEVIARHCPPKGTP